MKSARNIFEEEKHPQSGMGMCSETMVTFIILSLLSVMMLGYLIFNFDALSMKIALCVANILSSGFLILVAGLLIFSVIMRIRWGMYRRFWRW